MHWSLEAALGRGAPFEIEQRARRKNAQYRDRHFGGTPPPDGPPSSGIVGWVVGWVKKLFGHSNRAGGDHSPPFV
jgi:hypothetical protein